MNYQDVRVLHITCALLSLGGFALRGFWMWRESPWLTRRLTRTLPHINDTVLLGAAVWLAWHSGFAPWNTPWLGAKVLGLLTYIALGAIALRRGRTREIRAIAWCAALVVFFWILSVARLRTPAGFFSLLGIGT